MEATPDDTTVELFRAAEQALCDARPDNPAFDELRAKLRLDIVVAELLVTANEQLQFAKDDGLNIRAQSEYIGKAEGLLDAIKIVKRHF
jgi:hypothetical protein